VFRHGYNVLGPTIARRIASAWIADALYLVLIPFEFFAWLLVNRPVREPATDS
jgi:hypothetical protein